MQCKDHRIQLARAHVRTMKKEKNLGGWFYYFRDLRNEKICFLRGKWEEAESFSFLAE